MQGKSGQQSLATLLAKADRQGWAKQVSSIFYLSDSRGKNTDIRLATGGSGQKEKSLRLGYSLECHVGVGQAFRMIQMTCEP